MLLIYILNIISILVIIFYYCLCIYLLYNSDKIKDRIIKNIFLNYLKNKKSEFKNIYNNFLNILKKSNAYDPYFNMEKDIIFDDIININYNTGKVENMDLSVEEDKSIILYEKIPKKNNDLDIYENSSIIINRDLIPYFVYDEPKKYIIKKNDVNKKKVFRNENRNMNGNRNENRKKEIIDDWIFISK